MNGIAEIEIENKAQQEIEIDMNGIAEIAIENKAQQEI
jgi:hypothetical protein